MADRDKALRIIGKRNREKKKMLREQIKAGSARVEWANVDDRHTCFFCLENIAGTAQIIVEDGEKQKREYPICDPCYKSAEYF